MDEFTRAFKLIVMEFPIDRLARIESYKILKSLNTDISIRDIICSGGFSLPFYIGEFYHAGSLNHNDPYIFGVFSDDQQGKVYSYDNLFKLFYDGNDNNTACLINGLKQCGCKVLIAYSSDLSNLLCLAPNDYIDIISSNILCFSEALSDQKIF